MIKMTEKHTDVCIHLMVRIFSLGEQILPHKSSHNRAGIHLPKLELRWENLEINFPIVFHEIQTYLISKKKQEMLKYVTNAPEGPL